MGSRTLALLRQVPMNMFRAMLPGRSPARVQHSPDPTPGVVRDIELAVGTLCEPHRPMVGVRRQVHGPFTDEAVREDLRLVRRMTVGETLSLSPH